MANLFRNGSVYSTYRPTYPEELYERILAFSSLPEGQRRLAVDIATGSSQAAGALAKWFTRVIALDASPEQLAHAKCDWPNVEFRLGDACSTGLPDSCADLVTVAQALHWFDPRSFCSEARRILNSQGTLAVWCYGLACVEGPDHPADQVLRGLYGGVLDEYWDERRRLVERMYQGVEPVQGVDFAKVERQLIEMRHDVTVDALVGYVSSWSAFGSYCTAHGEEAGRKLMGDFKAQVRAALGPGVTDDSLVTLITPVALIMGKEPLQEP